MREAIEARIRELLAGTDAKKDWLTAGVLRHGFLPLHVGWTAALAIRPDGVLVQWEHDDGSDAVTILADGFWKRLALVEGAKKYPELGALAPKRPPEACDCQACGGSGKLAGLPENMTCRCGGLGWIIPGEAF